MSSQRSTSIKHVRYPHSDHSNDTHRWQEKRKNYMIVKNNDEFVTIIPEYAPLLQLIKWPALFIIISPPPFFLEDIFVFFVSSNPLLKTSHLSTDFKKTSFLSRLPTPFLKTSFLCWSLLFLLQILNFFKKTLFPTLQTLIPKKIILFPRSTYLSLPYKTPFTSLTLLFFSQCVMWRYSKRRRPSSPYI